MKDISTHAIAAYTKNSSPAYSVFLGESVHFALSCDGGKSFSPLFMNYGQLFAKCHFSDENGIVSAGVRDIAIDFTGAEYIISAKEVVRHQVKNGIFMTSFETEETGKFVRWITKDFVTFTEPELCDSRLPSGVQPVESAAKTACPALDIRDGDCVSLTIPTDIAERLVIEDMEVKCKEVCLPKSVVAKSASDVEDITAKVIYTDGTSHTKPVDWDLSGIDFDRPGKYTAGGKIRRRHFPFPVEKRAWGDPIITYYHGKYYFIGTDDWGGNKMFEAREADTPEALFAPDVKRSKILEYTEGKYESTFWAPEFHIAAGRMCLFCTLGKGGFDPQSHVMVLRDGGDILNPSDWSEPHRCIMPDGRFLSLNPLGDGKNGITLDMTYFEVANRGYVVWSFRTWAGTDSGSMLMLAETNPERPWELKTFPKLLCRPELGWENIDGTDNNEGPHPIVTEDKVYMAYSGGNAAGDTYVVGMLTADTCSDLDDPASWVKSQKPCLASDFVPGELGCGHNGFFTDELGDIYITYHGHKTLGNSDRIDGVRRVHFRPDGSPLLYMTDEQDLPAELEDVELSVVVPAK